MVDKQPSPDVIGMESLRDVLKSQLQAALETLREAIALCPDEVWSSREHVNAFWQVAYHTLYFTHLYLQPNEAGFRPWEGHQSEVQHPDGIAGPPDPESTLPLIPEEYSKAQVSEYHRYVVEMVDSCIGAIDLTSPESGFSWYRVSKLEHQLVNIRHVQHHAAQLADRLRSSSGIGIRWVDARRVDQSAQTGQAGTEPA